MGNLIIVLVWTILALFHLAAGFPTGAPISVCDTMLPTHGFSKPQLSPAPYDIIVNATTIAPGGRVAIKVVGKDGEPFRGIFLHVREVTPDTNEILPSPIGTYERNIDNVEIRTCAVSSDSITHKDGFNKYTVNVDWIAPLLLMNNVVVRATVVANFSTYWTRVASSLIYVKDTEESQAAIKAIGKPWLREIVSTLKVQDDIEATERAVVSRFEKGFNGVIDPRGHVISHYVLDLLNYQDSYKDVMFTPFEAGPLSVNKQKVNEILMPNNTQDFKLLNVQNDFLETQSPTQSTSSENVVKPPVVNTTEKKDTPFQSKKVLPGVKLEWSTEKRHRYETVVEAMLSGKRGRLVQELDDLLS